MEATTKRLNELRVLKAEIKDEIKKRSFEDTGGDQLLRSLVDIFRMIAAHEGALAKMKRRK